MALTITRQALQLRSFMSPVQVRGAYPLVSFYTANSTSLNLTVTGLMDAFGRTQPDAVANATYEHW